ncbi:uncharacterized protein [Aegilops tauschii subsp. strangulata]|nr:uncharacterized protein LOC109733400 [Aegilops tauschii subsp. strangulata]
MDWEGRAAFTSAWVLPVDHPLVRRVRPATTEARAAALRDLLVLWSSRGAETPRSRPPQPYAVAEAPFVDMQFRDVLVELHIYIGEGRAEGIGFKLSVPINPNDKSSLRRFP